MAGIIAPMTPPAPPRLPPYADALTGLRGMAALWVLAFHLWQYMGGPRLAIGPLDLTPLAARGHLGVDLFFVLSGYLIGGPWVLARLGGPKVQVGTFWKRRFLRVFPAYWAQWAILSALVLLSTHPYPATALQSVLGLGMAFNLLENGSPLNPVWWSLPIEWDFYLVAPWVAGIFATRQRLPILLVALVLASVTWRVLCWWMAHRYGVDGLWLARWIVQLPGRLDQFALGMLVAHALALGRGGSATRLFLAGLLATLVLVALHDYAGSVVDNAMAPWVFFLFTLFGCAFAALTAAAALPGSRFVQGLLGNRTMVFIGTISYSLYLWHYPVLEWLRTFAGPRGWATASWSWASSVVIASLGVAWLSWRLVERPFLPQRKPVFPPSSGDANRKNP